MFNSGLGTFYAAMQPALRAVEPASDPLGDAVAIVAVAYAAGLETGEAAATALLAVERDLLRGLRTAIDDALTIDTAALQPAFVALVIALAQAVVMAELALSPAIIARLVDDALDGVAVDATISVRLHPDDVASVADTCPVPIIAAPELARGSIAVAGPSFVVHDGLAARLAATAAALR